MGKVGKILKLTFLICGAEIFLIITVCLSINYIKWIFGIRDIKPTSLLYIIIGFFVAVYLVVIWVIKIHHRIMKKIKLIIAIIFSCTWCSLMPLLLLENVLLPTHIEEKEGKKYVVESSWGGDTWFTYTNPWFFNIKNKELYEDR